MRFVIESEIFTKFPGMKIVTAIVNSVHPITSDTQTELDAYATAAWQSAGQEVVKHGNAQSHPKIKPWGERMREVGVPRKHFPSSIEALARRAGKGDQRIKINPLVDFYNAISTKHIVPAGGFDIDSLQNDLCLRFSRQGDMFTALDSDEATAIPAGEVSYADGSEIITRHFVWKQSRHALITAESKNVIFVSEILGELSTDLVKEVCDAFQNGLAQYFALEARIAIMDEKNPSIELN
jgi:DNA/RNA-binding domain of Phe-tRNA-synthetase-like protein